MSRFDPRLAQVGAFWQEAYLAALRVVEEDLPAEARAAGASAHWVRRPQ